MRKILLLNILIIFSVNSYGQISDTNNTPPPVEKKKFGQTRGGKLVKTMIVPSALIGAGVLTMQGWFPYNRFDAKEDIASLNPHHKHYRIDDYLQYAPYVELVGLNLLKIKCRNDILNTTLLIVKSEIIMTAIVFPIKHYTGVERPDHEQPARFNSFPSGHTANAFVAASIVHKEFKHKSIWYGVGAYTVAGAVGVFRMINNRHWMSDVLAGAGVGMASVHLAYLTHQNRWGRKCDISVIPMYGGGGGLALVRHF